MYCSFWCFASTERADLERQIESSRKALDACISQKEAFLAEVSRRGKEEKSLTKVDALHTDVCVLEAECGDLQATLRSLLKSDPATIEALEGSIRDFVLRANQWTDNVFILRQFVSAKLGVPEAEVNRQFGIAQDFDLLDLPAGMEM